MFERVERGGASVTRRMSNALARSGLGRRLIAHVARDQPELLAGALGYWSSRKASLRGSVWSAQLTAFEDVAPLVLSSNAANRGLSSMSLVEAAHLWRLAAASPAPTLIEIGRERGGSTLVIAAAMDAEATLYSFDPQSKHGEAGAGFDDELEQALTHFGLDRRVRLSAEDSRTAALPPGGYGLVLVDGDPSYEGTRSDFERFCRLLVPGGSALFHDAVAGGPRQVALAPLLDEIDADAMFERRPDVGTFADYARR